MAGGPTGRNKNLPFIVCGVVGCSCSLIAIPIVGAIMLPVFSQARYKARDKATEVACLSNVKQSALATLMYVQDYDERMPPSNQWMIVSAPYIKNPSVFMCPALMQTPNTYGYSFDSRLSRKALADIDMPAMSALIYDSTDLRYNATDPCKTLPQPGALRHSGDSIAFTDGHARSFTELTLPTQMTVFARNPIAVKPHKMGK